MDQSTEQLLQSSFTSEGTWNSSDSGPSSLNSLHFSDTSPAVELITSTNSSIGPFGFRTRHLSCIEENESDSCNSLPSDFIEDAEKAFRVALDNKPASWEPDDIEYITTLDETYFMLNESKDEHPNLHDSGSWTTAGYGQLHTMFGTKNIETGNNEEIYAGSLSLLSMSGETFQKSYPKIMTTSCYGTLNNSFGLDHDGDDISNIITNKSQVEPEYAVVNKRGYRKDLMSVSYNGSNSNDVTEYRDLPEHAIKSSENILELSITSADGTQFGWSDSTTISNNMLVTANTDLQAVRRLLKNEAGTLTCPSCQMPFDKGKKRKLIDTCGHERCYMCMFRNERCPQCVQEDVPTQGADSVTIQACGRKEIESTEIKPVMPAVQPKNNIGYFSLVQPRPNSVSPVCTKVSPEKPYNAEPFVFRDHSKPCATPPQARRKFFNPKSLRSSFGIHRRTASQGSTETAALTDDEGGNLKPLPITGKSRSKRNEAQARIGFFLDGNASRNSRDPIECCSSLTSANTSPVSTLTGSSEADMSKQQCITYNTECESIGSVMSVSLSGQSNVSSSPGCSRSSVATAHNMDVPSPVKSRKNIVRRSAKANYAKDLSDPNNPSKQYRIPQLTLKPLFFEVPLQEPDPLFVGRQCILRELSNILTTTETPGVLINGAPGTGKTALILQLVEYSCFGRRKEMPLTENEGIYCQINVSHDRIRSLASHVVAYHFCQADNNHTCLVPDFIHSLAAQLCQAPQLIAYREYLMNEPHLQNILSVKECIADPDRVMRMGILEPLTTLKRSGKINVKHCFILIDALCEAEYHRPDHGYTISSFLGKMADYFPSWFKVVTTVRTQMLEFAKGLPYTKMTLDNLESNEFLQKDMIDYITFRIKHSSSIQNNFGFGKESNAAQKFASHLLPLTKGSFLYAKLSLDLIERGHLVIKSPNCKVLPISLAQIFLLHFNIRFPTTSSYDKVAPILNVCLASLYPLTLNEIYFSVFALTVDDSIEWSEFLQRFKLLSGFLVRRLDNTYMFFHPSFREWLIRRDDGESSKFLCDFRMGHTAIAFRLSRLQAPLDSEQTLELGHHILKAHIYRNSKPIQTPRDAQAYWVASVSTSVSSALCTLRNTYSPNIKVSRLLLLAGACPNYQTDFLGEATMLCIASYEGIVPMVSVLLEFGADVEKTNSQGCTPLILASVRGHCDVVRLLVAAGSRLGQSDTTQRCALVHAARSGKVNVVKYLLACDWNVKTNMTDISLEQAAQQSLVAAASQGNISILEDLLDITEVSIDAIDSLTGDTALSAAAKHGRTETVCILLARGATVDKRNQSDMSPLLLAVKEGHWAVVERLLQQNSDIDQIDSEAEKTPLIIASAEGHVGIIELLIEKGSSLERKDSDGLTALSWACLRGRLQGTKCLLEKGANIKISDIAGRTPLDLAAYQGSSSLVQLLLDKGAVLEHVDVNGMRPLDRAIACRNIPVVQVFLKRGAKLGPATWAMAAGKPDIILLLLNKLLEDGNILYRKNHLQEAAHRYRYALRKIAVTEPQIEHKATFRQLKVNFLLNLSRCKRKMNELAEAIDLAGEAVEIKPSSYEGYYARAKAYLENGDLADALKDADFALQKAQNKSDVTDVLNRLRNDIINASTELYETTDL